MFNRYDTIPACDGHTDILRQHSPRYAQHRAVKMRTDICMRDPHTTVTHVSPTPPSTEHLPTVGGIETGTAPRPSRTSINTKRRGSVDERAAIDTHRIPQYLTKIPSTATLHCVSKNVRSLTGYNFNTQPPIFIIFGTCQQQTFKNQLEV